MRSARERWPKLYAAAMENKMRNLKEYPVTKEEIISFLEEIYEEGMHEIVVGDIAPLLLNEAIKHVRGSKLQLSDLGTVQGGSEGLGGGGRSGISDGGNQDGGFVGDDRKNYRR